MRVRWFSSLWKSPPRAGRRPQPRVPRLRSFRPLVEELEARALLATLTVSTLSDSGTGSLRAQTAAAAAGDTIVFQSGLSGTIQMDSGQGEMVINKDLTILGPAGAASIT